MTRLDLRRIRRLDVEIRTLEHPGRIDRTYFADQTSTHTQMNTYQHVLTKDLLNP